MSDPAHLWSAYGLRSLSASHPLFGQGEDYWRGPIWIQMNWMALGALDKYRREEGPQKERAGEIYAELRKNVIENVFNVGHRHRGTPREWPDMPANRSTNGQDTSGSNMMPKQEKAGEGGLPGRRLQGLQADPRIPQPSFHGLDIARDPQ